MSAARWIQKNSGEKSSSNNKRRKRSGSKKSTSRSENPRRSVEKAGKVKKPSGPAFRAYVEKPEEIAAYTDRDINLDPDPGNQEARIAKLSTEIETLEQDLAPLSDDDKKGMQELLEEA